MSNRDRRAERERNARHMRESERKAGLNRRTFNYASAAPEGWQDRIAEIPEDTRSLTARTFGDPLPTRSALDKELRQ